MYITYLNRKPNLMYDNYTNWLLSIAFLDLASKYCDPIPAKNVD